MAESNGEAVATSDVAQGDAVPMDIAKEEQQQEEVVLGIDFGSQTCVVSAAILGQGLPKLIPNNLSNISTPNCVSFRSDERVIGEEAANRIISDAQSTVSLLKLLLGKNYSDLSQEFISSLSYPLVNDNANILVKVNYGENGSTNFSVEHLAGMILKRLVHFATVELKPKVPITKAVIAVPSSWGQKEKRAMLDAAKIAGIEVLHLISENTATALAYGYTHDLQNETDPARKVAVVNLGHQFFAVQIVEYTKNRLKVLSSTCDSGIGGGVIDSRLVHHFTEEFQQKYKVDASSNVKAKCKLARACEKAKKVLSTIPETDLELDCLMDDVFVKGKIQRTALEELIADQLNKIKESIATALSAAGVTPAEIEEIEIVGGGTRIPSVQNVVKESFEGKELAKNIDGTSAVAEGAGIYAGILTPGFGYSYNVEDSFLEEVHLEGLSEEKLNEFITIEKKLDDVDRIREEAQNKKNELEGTLYDIRNKAGDKFAKEVDDKSQELSELFQRIEDWLYEDGEHATKEEYEIKINELNTSVSTIAPAFHAKLVELQEQKAREIAAAEEERRKRAAEPQSGRDKVEKPLTKKEKVDAASKRKNQGNTCFKDGDFEGAVTRYVGAINLIDDIWSQLTEEEKPELKETKLSSLLNIAMCCLKLENFPKTIDMCKKALEIDPDNVKALFRRAHAYRNQKEYDLALVDLTKASKIEPENNDVRKGIQMVKKLLEDERARQKKTYAKMFS